MLADPGVRAELERAPIAGHRRLDTLLAACGGDRSVDHDTADALLGAGRRRGPRRADVGRAVVLQRALGSLVTIAVRRTRGQPGRRAALFDELCSTAWIVIGSYPLARRPRCSADQRRPRRRVPHVRAAAAPPRRQPSGHPARRARARGRPSRRAERRTRPTSCTTSSSASVAGAGSSEGDLALLHALAGRSVRVRHRPGARLHRPHGQEPPPAARDQAAGALRGGRLSVPAGSLNRRPSRSGRSGQGRVRAGRCRRPGPS